MPEVTETGIVEDMRQVIVVRYKILDCMFGNKDMDCPARVVEWNKEHMSEWTNELSTTWKIKWTTAS